METPGKALQAVAYPGLVLRRIDAEVPAQGAREALRPQGRRSWEIAENSQRAGEGFWYNYCLA